MSNDTADIIIVGGGLLGTATAYQLARRRAGRIVVLERTDVAAQASSRAACLLTRARTKHILMPMVQETYDCIEQLEEQLGQPLGLQQTGSVTTAASPAAEQGLDALERAAELFGIASERIDGDEACRRLPWLRPGSVTRALYMPTDAYIDSARLCNSYAEAARRLGATLRCRCGVRSLLCRNGRIAGVELDDGQAIEAPVVVDAAGAWANLLAVPAGAGLPMTPVRSHFWISERDEKRFPPDEPFAVLPDARAFTRPDVGALIIGLREPECVAYDARRLPARIEHFDFTPDNGWSVLEACADGFERFFPHFRQLGLAHYVAGPSCYVPDALFVVGALPAVQGLYAATGCCGAGVAAGGGIGRLTAELICGERTFVDAAPFDPTRFGAIAPFDETFRETCAAARSHKKGG